MPQDTKKLGAAITDANDPTVLVGMAVNFEQFANYFEVICFPAYRF